MRNSILFTLALIASAAVLAPAAGQATEPTTVTSIVHTADLDLKSRDGLRELDRRIGRAAREVCGTVSDADLAGKNDVRQCRAETIAAAELQRAQLLAARFGSPILVASAR
jgi:UrcA family protein